MPGVGVGCEISGYEEVGWDGGEERVFAASAS